MILNFYFASSYGITRVCLPQPLRGKHLGHLSLYDLLQVPSIAKCLESTRFVLDILFEMYIEKRRCPPEEQRRFSCEEE
jgi:hypothetical protein